MRVKVISVKDKNEGHVTQGHGAVGIEGEAIFRADNKLLIPEGGGLLTSTIQRITVETRNSVYELESAEALHA